MPRQGSTWDFFVGGGKLRTPSQGFLVGRFVFTPTQKRPSKIKHYVRKKKKHLVFLSGATAPPPLPFD